jgi:predicted Zn-dependent protease
MPLLCFGPRSIVLGAALCWLPWLLYAKPCLARQTHTPQTADTIGLEALQAQALREGEAGQASAALRDYQQALARDPTWKEGWWNLAALQYSADQFADAATTLRRVVAFAPDLGMAWSLLGLSEFETKDFANALSHLEKAHALGIPDDLEMQRISTYHLALLLLRSSQFDRASDLLLTTFRNGLLSAQVKTALGLALLRVPLLPSDLDPSQEALVATAGNLAAEDASDTDTALAHFPALLQSYPEVPYLHYAYGLALAKAARTRQAFALLEQETKISPASPLPWIAISHLALSAGKTATPAAQRAVALAPTSKAAHDALAAALLASGDRDHAAREQKLAASLDATSRPPEQRLLVRYANKTLAGPDPTPAPALWSRAMQEYSQFQFPAAAADLKEYLRRNPANGTGWAVLGLSEFALNDLDSSLLHLERGEQLGLSGSPQSLQSAKYTLGLLLIRAGEFDHATDVLASALKTDPREADSDSNASSNAVSASNSDFDARIELALGLAVLRQPTLPAHTTPNQTSLLRTTGKISLLLRRSQYDAAFPLLRKLLQQYPKTPFLHYIYGTALLAVSEFEEAAAQMQAELPLSPASDLPLVRLASIALRQHHPADAIVWVKRALMLSPNSADAHYLYGRAALEQADDPIALRELKAAASLSPNSPEIHFNLAKAYARARMPEQAERERAAFTGLNAAAEAQRSQSGTQIYAGPHDAGDITPAAPTQAASSSQLPD